MVSPAYFAGAVQLGGLMQTASAFSSVQTSLSFFITRVPAARGVALGDPAARRLRASGRDRARRGGDLAAGRGRAGQGQERAFELHDLAVGLPNGTPLVAADAVAIAPGDRVLVNGPSGSGKSTLFRAIAGIWPFGRGRVSVPEDARVMMLPQRPYFPVGSLAAAVTYPAEAGAFGREQLAEALGAVGLPALAARLDEEAHWNRMLSLGEQQRLGIARAILQAPDYLFLDEATASLDEPSEAALYRLVAGAAAARDHRLDRPPVDADRLPRPPPAAGARRRPLPGAGDRDEARGVVSPDHQPCAGPRTAAAEPRNARRAPKSGGRVFCGDRFPLAENR